MAIAMEEQAAGTFHHPVVLLADRPKDEMDAAVEAALGADSQLEVITRSGCAHSIDDLEKGVRW